MSSGRCSRGDAFTSCAGVQRLHAIEMRPIFALDVNLPAGTKVMAHFARIARCQKCLDIVTSHVIVARNALILSHHTQMLISFLNPLRFKSVIGARSMQW